ncbi:MAG: ANTAR domain-containing protein [Candidatus Gastranaerophilales bacterium]|nr:ANTAR domain-containing protein [Candidatus Gastranaerophilales bacterium]
MTTIIVALPRIEDAKGIKSVMVRNGFHVTGVCTTGAQAISLAEGLNDGIVVCSYKLVDMMYTELRECLPSGFEMLLMASRNLISQCYGSNVMCLAMPLKTVELIATLNMLSEGIGRRRRKRREKPRVWSSEEKKILQEAKEVLKTRNHMTEEEAHRYIQKCSMDSGTNMVETAQMVLAMMGG